MAEIAFPNKIMISKELEDEKVLEEWLSQKTTHKVVIHSPKKGAKLRFVEMAEKNSKVTLENKEKTQNSILLELKVITRRLAHSVENPEDKGFGKIPDAIFADGGITQIRAVRKAVDKYGVDIKIFGMVKNDKHQTRALMDEDRNEIEISEKLFNLITLFQDTVHDTAISYHRKLRDKALIKSELDDIDGIGEAKKKALIKEFGSVERIREASVEEIAKVKGINKSLAEKIKKVL